MRKLSFWVITIFLALLLAIWAPWNQLDFSILEILNLQPEPANSSLQVSSLAGDIEVFIDGSQDPIETVSQGQTAIIPGIEVGRHQIRLSRVSENPNVDFWEYNKVIDFVEGVDVILTYELGPEKEFSAGHLIYATPTEDESQTTLSVSTNTRNSQVKINNNIIGTAPLASYRINTQDQQRLEVSQPGYETQEFLLLPGDPSEREQLSGYDLIVEVDLLLQPIAVEEV